MEIGEVQPKNNSVSANKPFIPLLFEFCFTEVHNKKR
jgi:hypothetical protein